MQVYYRERHAAADYKSSYNILMFVRLPVDSRSTGASFLATRGRQMNARFRS